MAENDLYIPHMTFIVCDKGASVMNLKVNPKKHKLYGLTIATDKDNIPLVNIPTFGVCSIDGKPCVAIKPEWKKVHEGAQKVEGQRPLLHTSYCKCQKGGTMKLHFDKAEAQASLDDAIKNRVDGIDWLDEAIGSAIMGPIGSMVSKIKGGEHTTINQDVGRGVRKALKGTWNFFTEDIKKGETWSAMGKMTAISVVGYTGTSDPLSASAKLQAFDAVFGTDLNQTHDAMIEGIITSVDEKIINGTEAERGEVFGVIAGGVIEGVVGSKGTGLVVKGLKAGTKLAIGAEKFAQLTATISKLQQAAKLSNIASKIKGIFKVGRKPWMGRNGFFSYGDDLATEINKSRLLKYPVKGYYDVLIHGYPYMFEPIKGQLINASELYARMISAGYKKGTPIRLISCSTGKELDGAAQQLSNLAKAKVIAPTDLVRTAEDGVLYVKNNGHFRIFYPQ